MTGLAYGGYRLYLFTEYDPNFCASCHIMEKAWETWAAGPHKKLHCKACHSQDILTRARIVWSWTINKTEEVPPHTLLDKRVCEKCHIARSERWVQMKNTAGHMVHVTKANIQCLACHYPSLHNFEPEVIDCLRCHDKARINIGEMKDLHCTTCHNFLAKGKGEELMPLRGLCLECHEDMQIKNETFPKNGSMEFECAKCHKPHTKPFLDFSDCLACHIEITESKDHFNHKALTGCVKCHKPHDWKATEW